MNKYKTVMVTGGSGYFGTILINYLLKKKVLIKNFDISKPEETNPNVKYLKGDILNYNDINNSLKNVDTIFHNVANLPLAKDKEKYNSINVDGTKNMLEAALNNNVRKVIYTSTGAVFGIPKSNPVKDTDIPKPQEEYGLTKYIGEKVCKEYIKKGISITIIRPNTILGIGRLGTLSLLFKWIDEGYNIPVFSGGGNRYQFTHAEDLSRLCYYSSLEDESQIYNCAAKDNLTMIEIMTELCEFAKTNSKIRSVPMWPAILLMNILNFFKLSPLVSYHSLMYGRSIYFDMTKNKERLNWEPKYTNAEMMIQSYKWYISNKNKLLSNKKNDYDHQAIVKEGFLKYLKKLL